MRITTSHIATSTTSADARDRASKWMQATHCENVVACAVVAAVEYDTVSEWWDGPEQFMVVELRDMSSTSRADSYPVVSGPREAAEAFAAAGPTGLRWSDFRLVEIVSRAA